MDINLDNLSLFSHAADAAPTGGDDPVELDVDRIDPFPAHPYHVEDDQDMERLVDSIRDNGIITPLLARPRGERYQLVSGHRRLHAARRLGLARVPARVEPMDDDTAVIRMVDSNLNRTRIPLGQQAKAMRMRQQAIIHQGHADGDGPTRERLAKATGVSPTSVARLVRLGTLDDRLLTLLDDGRMPARAGLALADTSRRQQEAIADWVNGRQGRRMGIRHARLIAEQAERDHDLVGPASISLLEPAPAGNTRTAGPGDTAAATLTIPIDWIPAHIDAGDRLEWIHRLISQAAGQAGEETA